MSEKPVEQELVQAMTGTERPSALMTDGYKFSMAQAGFPLRKEKFYLTLRRGGPYFIPFDLVDVAQRLVPEMPTTKEQGFLQANGYGMNPAMEEALKGELNVWAAPKGSWVIAREPIMVPSGSSFLVSWLEPLAIMLNYPIQVATAYLNGQRDFETTCWEESLIVQLTLTETARLTGVDESYTVTCLSRDYGEGLKRNIAAIKEALGGKLNRAFEVGMRGATCMEQHRLALMHCREAGMLKTSNVFLAWELYMTPVGTTGHEHQQRWGNDKAGFEAIRDMRPEQPSYLFDTYNPIEIGIPAAMSVMETDERPCSMRFDSGDQDAQFLKILAAVRREYPAEGQQDSYFEDRPNLNLIFEDGYTADKTAINETFCAAWKWPEDRRHYGYGGYIVTDPSPSAYGRNMVSAAYKLTETGGQPRMKFSGTPGKESIPGKPVILRRIRQDRHDPKREQPPKGYQHAYSVIAQEGESIPAFRPLDPVDNRHERQYELRTATELTGATLIPFLSPQTQELIARLTAERDQMVEDANANS